MKTQDEVLRVIHTYFSREPIMGTSETSSKQFIELLKAELSETWKEKDAYSDRWDALLQGLTNLPGVYKPRDMPHDSLSGYKAVVQLRTPQDHQRLVGVIINISLIGNSIGYYYHDTIFRKTKLLLNLRPRKAHNCFNKNN